MNAEEAHTGSLGCEVARHINRGILKPDERGDNECGSFRAVDAVVPLLTGAGILREHSGPVAVGQIVPFVQVAFGGSKSPAIEELADRLRSPHQFRRIVRVAVPREEIEWRAVLRTPGQKRLEELRRSELALLERSRVAEAGTADFELGKLRPQQLGGGRVEFEIFLVGTGPAGGSVVGFVPYLPIFDGVLEAL